MVKYWIRAARPKTLLVSVAPVIVALAMAFNTAFEFLPALICLLFAVLAQVISNLVNDYADWAKGSDDCSTRLGPQRMVSSGLIPPSAMKRAVMLLSLLAACLGLSLIYWGGWILLPVGVLVFAGAYSYSAGPFPLAYNGLGDVAVVLFYGFVPVVFTYYILCGSVGADVCLAGVSIGVVADNLLLVNNFRDVQQDREHNKRTTVVLFGKGFALAAYIAGPVLAVVAGYFFVGRVLLWSLLALPFLLYVVVLWLRFRRAVGAELNALLGKTSLLAVLYAVMVAVAV